MKIYIFFLGGYDAEMVEIRKILEGRGEKFYDKQLSWGVALSDYGDEIKTLSSEIVPVFIELKLDCPYPDNAAIIDHHGEEAGKDKKTSIEQVADLLGVKLNRTQQLISANDRGYINAMKELGASENEIQHIRKIDRSAQGITKEDERLATESVKNNLIKIKDDTVIVNSLTNRTTPVFDRLVNKYGHIFILTPDGELNYSGEGNMVFRLVKIYKEKKAGDPQVDFWYGGDLPKRGFFGVNKALSEEEIKNVIRRKD